MYPGNVVGGIFSDPCDLVRRLEIDIYTRALHRMFMLAGVNG